MSAALDPHIAELVDQLNTMGLPSISTMTVEELRSRARPRGDETPPDWWGAIESTEQLSIPAGGSSLDARLYRPLADNAVAGAVILFIHGGGWVTGDLDGADGVARMLAAESGSAVVSTHYRLAPEDPFPAAIDDVAAALRWLRENASAHGFDPRLIAVSGDSAGGNLAAVLAQQDSAPSLAAQLLIYPAVSGRADGFRSFIENARAPMLDQPSYARFLAWYGGDPEDPRFAPLRSAEAAGSVPAVIGVAGFDPLRDEGIDYAERLRRSGGRVVLRRYDSLVHGFFAFAPVSAAAESASRQLCRDIGSLLRKQQEQLAPPADTRITRILT